MAQALRPLRTQHPITCSCSNFLHLISPFFPTKSSSISPIQHNHHLQRRRYLTTFVTLPLSARHHTFRPKGLRLAESHPLQSDSQGNDSDSDSAEKKSRNERKRQARRAVKWAIELASFSNPQIKQILRVAATEKEVFEALMLVKKLGPDVKEGKRRQFNYIGSLLRDVEPELMEALIQASKDGDNNRLEALSSTVASVIGEDEAELEETESDNEEEESHNSTELATRWLEGFINKESDITNEVYSIHSVDFDRQELRKLVRNLHSNQERSLTSENKDTNDKALVGAKKSLRHFLLSLAKQMPSEQF